MLFLGPAYAFVAPTCHPHHGRGLAGSKAWRCGLRVDIGQATNSGVLQSRKLFSTVVSSSFTTVAADAGESGLAASPCSAPPNGASMAAVLLT